jgi:hypothetical protein
MRVPLILASLLLAAYILWPSSSPTPDHGDDGDPALLTGRVWLSAMPTAPRDEIHAMFAMAETPLGVFQRASAYQASLEVFEYEREDAALSIRFPQSGRKAETGYRAYACADHPPFDLCLDVNKNPWSGPSHFYGFRDDAAAPAEIRALRHRLVHAVVQQP